MDDGRLPLKPPYAGLFCLVKRGPKAFILDAAGRHDRVSVDRPKPVIIEYGLNDGLLSCHELHHLNRVQPPPAPPVGTSKGNGAMEPPVAPEVPDMRSSRCDRRAKRPIRF